MSNHVFPAGPEFVLTDEHIKLLRAMGIGWQNCEFGAPEVDPKRPYGNSSVVPDIAEILGLPLLDKDGADYNDRYGVEAVERMRRLHRETDKALQIILATCAFEPGTYRQTDRYSRRSWVRVS